MLSKLTSTSNHLVASTPELAKTTLRIFGGCCWFPVIISGCMALYVVGASRQDVRWFSPTHNPYLHAQLIAGAGALALGFRPPKAIILLAGASWAGFAAIITRQRMHFKEWRYIVSAHIPLVALFCSHLML